MELVIAVTDGKMIILIKCTRPPIVLNIHTCPFEELGRCSSWPYVVALKLSEVGNSQHVSA